MVLPAGRLALPANPSRGCCCATGEAGACRSSSTLRQQQQQQYRSMALMPVLGTSKTKLYSGMCRCLVTNINSPATLTCFSRSQSFVESLNPVLGFGKGVLRDEKQQRHGRRHSAVFREISDLESILRFGIDSPLAVMGAGALSSFSFRRPDAGLQMYALQCFNPRNMYFASIRQIGLAAGEIHEPLNTQALKLPSLKNDVEGTTLKSWGKKGWGRRRRQGQIVKSSSEASVGRKGESVQKKEANMKVVVVVESPAKARAIENYLGEGYIVLASYGHVRDLAARSGSVRPKEDFAMLWEVPSTAQAHINSIKAALKGAKSLVLASDPDREGEAIAWHIHEMIKMDGILKNGMKVKRVAFHEITKSAIQRAMASPREISETLVNAYLARRALDYLIGFDLSPLLWRKLPGSKSAGRVQSAALSLICEREAEIDAFLSRMYWTVEAEVYKKSNVDPVKSIDETGSKSRMFVAKLTHFKGNKLEQFSLASSEDAKLAAQAVAECKLRVANVKKNLVRRHAPMPYITSSLQQDASNKLSFGASKTMAVAQQLYEGIKLTNNEITGLITYMRTDSHQLSSEAVHNIRTLAAERYGQEYVPLQARQFTARVKNAQEAHEAIRATDIFRLPSMLVDVLEPDALRLYALIWSRTVACQMEQAIYNQVAVDLADASGNVRLRSTGSTITFPGYLAVFEDNEAGMKNQEDPEEEKEELPTNFLQLEAGDQILLKGVEPRQHVTEPPHRFSEGSLVKKLEELGIGRPSTYASILKTLQTRKYMKVEKRRIFPEIRGRMVAAFLSHYFPDFVDYGFTAKMEAQLDEVSTGKANWKEILRGFWGGFHEKVSATMKISNEQVREILEGVFAEKFFSGLGSTGRICPSCGEGKLSLKLSRFGSGFFFGCNLYPECQFKTNLLIGDDDDAQQSARSAVAKETSEKSTYILLGLDPKSGLQVMVKVGPFGPYVQLGESTEKQKPKRSTIPKAMRVEDIDLNAALEMLKFPRELGKHPQDGGVIILSIGPYGYFLRHKATMAPLAKGISPKELTLEKAVQLLDGRNISKRGRKPRVEIKENVNRECLSEQPLLELSKNQTKSSKSGTGSKGTMDNKLEKNRLVSKKKTGRSLKQNLENKLLKRESMNVLSKRGSYDAQQASVDEAASKNEKIDLKGIESSKKKDVVVRKQNKAIITASRNRDLKSRSLNPAENVQKDSTTRKMHVAAKIKSSKESNDFVSKHFEVLAQVESR